METSVVATPLVRAWNILAELAAYGKRDEFAVDPGELAQAIADLIATSLACPWGLVVLSDGTRDETAGWGLEPQEMTRFANGDGVNLPDDTVEIRFEHNGQPAGLLLLGVHSEAREAASPPFLAALRNQIELLINIQRRTAQTSIGEQRRTSVLSTLQVVGQQLSVAQNADVLLTALIDGVGSLVGFDAAEICLYHPQSQSLAVALTRGIRHRGDYSRTLRLSDGLVGWVARQRRSLRLADIRDAPVRSHIPYLSSGTHPQSYFGIPLQSDDRLLGTLELFSERPSHFSASDERLIGIAVSQASQSLAGMQRYEESDEFLAKRMQQLKALQRISRELTATLYLHNILGFALSEALRATHADTGYIALRGYEATQQFYDLEQEDALGVTPTPQIYIALREVEDTHAMRVIAADGYTPDESRRLLNHSLQGSKTIAMDTVNEGEAQIVDEIHGDDRPRGVGPTAASALAVPIYYEAQVIGVVNLHSQVPFTFDRDAIEFVRAVGDLIALAIGNEQRWTEQRRQRDLLQQRANTLNEVLRIGQELRADRSLEDVLEQIAFSIIETAGFRAVVFYLADHDERTMRVHTGAGLPLTEIERLRRVYFPIPTAEGLLDLQFQIGRCFYIPGPTMRVIAPGLDLIEGDAANSDDGWERDDALFVPLYSTRGQLIGLLGADEPYDHQRPTRRSVESIEIFADQAAIAIENANLLREARTQAEQMTALYRASTSAAATLDLDELLEQTYREVEVYLGVPSFMYVAAYDAQLHNIRFELFKREGQTLDRLHKTQSPKQGWTGYIIDSGIVLHIRDAFNEQELPTVQPIMLGEEIRSYIGIPLRSQGETIGVLSVQSFEPHAFSETDVQFLSTLANQLAVALEKLRLFRERERRIEELNVINRIGRITAATLDIEQMFTQVYECLAGFIAIDAFYAIVYQAERNEISMALMVDEGLHTFNIRNGPPDPGSLTAWILQDRKPLRFADLRLEQAQDVFQPTPFGNEQRRSAAWLGVPLLIGDGGVVGVLSIQSYTADLYGEREQSFLTTVANQVALGVQNAVLLDQARSQVRQLALINRVSATAAATLEFEQVFYAAADAMAQATNADKARLILYDRASSTAQLVWQDHGDVKRSDFSLVGHPLVDWLDTHRSIYFASDARVDPMLVWWHETFRNHDIQSMLVVPLVSKEQVIGAVRLDYIGRRHDPSERELELSLTIANQTAVALENARLFEETQLGADRLQYKVGELSALLEAARVLSSSLKPLEVLDSLMDVVGRQLRVDTVALWQENTEHLLLPVAMMGIPREVAQTLQVPVGTGLTGRVAALGTPLVVVDVEHDGSSLYPNFNRTNKYTSFMGVPVRYRDRTIGVLSVMTIDTRAFNSDEVQLLAGMADQAAVALENAHLFDEREQRIAELMTLNRISQAINGTLDVNELLMKLFQGMGEVLDTSQTFIALYDNMTRVLSFPIFTQDGIAQRNVANTTLDANDAKLSSLVINERHSLLLSTQAEVDAISQELPEPRDKQIASWLGVPILLGSRVLGILNAQSYDPYRFNEDHLRFLETVASQAATALGNARLFSERERRLREVSVLQEIGSAINSTLDLQTVLERLHAQIGRVVDVGTSAVVLYDAERDLMVYPIAYDLGQRVEIPQLPPQGGSGWVIHQRQPLLLHTAEEFDLINYGGPHYGASEATEQSFLIVPILSGEAVLGVLDIQSYTPYAFNRDDLRFMVTVASQAAVAITNARLFQERGRKIDELATFNKIGQELSAVSSQEELLETIYRQTSRLLDTKNFYISIYDSRRDAVTLPLVIEDGKRVEFHNFYALSDTLTGYVIQNRSTLLLNQDVDAEIQARNIHALESNNDPNDQPKSWLGVPMIAADKVVGTIGIQNTEREHAYSADDVRLLETIAAWGATALENARLLSETRQSNRDLTALYDVSVALTSSLHPSDIQTTAATSVLELLRADVCIVVPLDARRRPLAPTVADHSDAPFDSEMFVQLSMPLVSHLNSSSALALNDLASEAPELAQVSGLGSLLGLVISASDQIVGIIWAGQRSSRSWQDREVSLLSILSNQLSQSLTRAQLLLVEQERRRVADTLRETAQMFTRLRTPEGIYEIIFDQLALVVNYDTASLMQRDGDNLFVMAGRGFASEVKAEVEALRFNVSDDPYLEQVLVTRQPVVLHDAQATPYLVPAPGSEYIRGWIGAPLLVDDEVIGLLCVDNRIIGAYDEDDGQIAFTLASQAAQAIRNARLYQEVTQLNAELEVRVEERTAELREEQDRLRAVHAITIELAATLELQPTLNRALELAADALEARRGSIMLRDMQENELICRAVLAGAGEALTTEIPINFAQGGGLAGWVIRQRRAACIPDVLDDPRWLREEGRADDIRSVIVAPLMTQDGPLGVLMLSSPKVDFFREAQVQLLTTIANEIAIVIHNATLYKVISELAYDRGLAESQQREENSKNQAILQSLGEGVIVLDEQQQVVLFNPAAEQMLAIPASFVSGQPLRYLLEYDNTIAKQRAGLIYEGVYQGLRTLNDQAKNYNRTLSLPTPSQTIALNFAAWVGPRGAVYGSVVVLRDVTREIESDRAKREFISSVSHELRTPLTSIKGYVDLLLLGAAGQLSEGQLSFLNVVKNNANRLMDLINDILEIGRIDSEKIQLNFEQVNIRNIFNDVLQTLQVQIDRKEMLVETDMDAELPEVSADLRRLTQVVMNLVSNAIKYTFPKGQITLKSFLNPAGMLQVDVEDSGVGISAEDQKNLFRRFQRFDNPLRDEAGGTGLGLSIAKSFVELHGGEMWVVSEPGMGSTFSFIVPVSQPDQDATDE